MERVVQIPFETSHYLIRHTRDTFGLGKYNNCSFEVFLAVKTLKTAGRGEIWAEMLKTLDQGVLQLTPVCQMA